MKWIPGKRFGNLWRNVDFVRGMREKSFWFFTCNVHCMCNYYLSFEAYRFTFPKGADRFYVLQTVLVYLKTVTNIHHSCWILWPVFWERRVRFRVFVEVFVVHSIWRYRWKVIIALTKNNLNLTQASFQDPLDHIWLWLWNPKLYFQ